MMVLAAPRAQEPLEPVVLVLVLAAPLAAAVLALPVVLVLGLAHHQDPVAAVALVLVLVMAAHSLTWRKAHCKACAKQCKGFKRMQRSNRELFDFR